MHCYIKKIVFSRYDSLTKALVFDQWAETVLYMFASKASVYYVLFFAASCLLELYGHSPSKFCSIVNVFHMRNRNNIIC